MRTGPAARAPGLRHLSRLLQYCTVQYQIRFPRSSPQARTGGTQHTAATATTIPQTDPDNTLTNPVPFTLLAPSTPGLSATEIAGIAGGAGVAAVGGGLLFLRRRKKPATQPSAQTK